MCYRTRRRNRLQNKIIFTCEYQRKYKNWKKNEIFPFVSIGTPPQDLKYKGEKNTIIIGDNNKLREYVNINPGTAQGGTITKLGNNNLLMVYCHVAHDCKLGDNIVLANNVQVGGHVTIDDYAIVGGSCAIHRFSRIGQLAMVGGMTGVLSDVIPFGLSMGNRNNLTGLNLIGLRRSKVCLLYTSPSPRDATL